MFLSTSTITTTALLILLPKSYSSKSAKSDSSIPEVNFDLSEFTLNLEHLEAKFFLYGPLGYDLDKIAPNLTLGGPTSIGGKHGKMDNFTRDVIKQFALHEVGTPKACECSACYCLLAVESGQDTVIRLLLYEQANTKVDSYGKTVTDFTSHFSKLRNKLGNVGVKDEDLVVREDEGAKGLTTGNVLSVDKYSAACDRTSEILRIVYGSDDESRPEGFYPKGAHLSKVYYNTILARCY